MNTTTTDGTESNLTGTTTIEETDANTETSNMNMPSENSYEQLITQQQFETATEALLYIEYVLLPLSFVLTVINIVVFCQRSMKSATSTYVIALSQSQVVYLLLSALGHVLKATIPTSSYGFIFYFLYIAVYGSAVVRRASYLVTCLLSTERLYAVVRPLHVKEFVLVRFPIPFIVAAYVAVAAYHVYLALKYSVESFLVPRRGVVYTFVPTPLYLNNRQVMDGVGVGAKVLFSYTPLLALVLLNLFTILALRRHSVTRRQLKSSTTTTTATASSRGEGSSSSTSSSTNITSAAERRERQLTVTVVVATACYVVLSLPLAFHSLLISLLPVYGIQGKESRVYRVMEDVGFVCTLLSYCTDFVTFALLSSTFRNTCLRLVPSFCRSQGGQAASGGGLSTMTSLSVIASDDMSETKAM